METNVLTPEAVQFFDTLHKEFNPARKALLEDRIQHRRNLQKGRSLGLLEKTLEIRESSWTVSPAPPDLMDRRVEITGPAESKMMINALNSGAKVFMADLEDALSPTWKNVLEAQQNLMNAVRGTLTYTSTDGNKTYTLNPQRATLVVRPRGWHLEEKHFTRNNEPVSGSLFDFALYFFHNAKELLSRGTGPYFYLPKLENHLEARLWNQVFNRAQDLLGIPQGTIRVTVLIETITAAFEMEEILFELKEHICALNAGRWDYLFSTIKNFSFDSKLKFPDRAQLTMTVPFMKAYAERLVQVCHYRGAHAIGGMAAFIPHRRDPAINETALAKVREDKEREALQGFDGTWVAHPDLVPIANAIFTKTFSSSASHQKHRFNSKPNSEIQSLLNFSDTPGEITEKGFRTNIQVALRYLEAWFHGQGAVAIHHLMEDVATAEISRAQLWQWTHHQMTTSNGLILNKAYFERVLQEEVLLLKPELPEKSLMLAVQILEKLIQSPYFPDFLTTEAYRLL